ncbi:MAG: hypothetical protein HUJ68_00945 [Clostridia bacterium]|nr:hypothetical protein [Clostridia bacterium]
MKKIAIFFLCISAILSAVFYAYYNYNKSYNMAKKENSQFERFINNEISGLELATVINKTIDYNTKNEIEKDEQGIYIDNNKNSIKIDVKFIENEEKKTFITHNMETIYKVGIQNLLNVYSNSKFKCNYIEYHKNTGKIKYIIFEQIIQ